MLLLYLNAQWRAEVMPDNEENYHFSLCDLTESQKKFVRSQPWVQASYDHYTYNAYTDELMYNDFRVRVDWEHVVGGLKYARELFDIFDLWHSPYYKDSFEWSYNYGLKNIMTRYLCNSPDDILPNGMTAAESNLEACKTVYIFEHSANRYFYQNTINPPILRPNFITTITFVALFLIAAMAIIQTENYHNRAREFGSLRALGMKKRQIVYICLAENILTSLASIPVGTIFAFAFVKLYMTLFGKMMAENNIYLTLLGNIPIECIVFVSVELVILASLGCAIVCVLNMKIVVIDLLRDQMNINVSFVSKTSPKFEKSCSSKIYSRLYLGRTRRSLISSIIVTFLMVPLPLSFLAITRSDIVHNAQGIAFDAIYDGFQTLILYITTSAIIYVSTKSSIDRRRGEIGILRSLGMRRSSIKNAIHLPLYVNIAMCSFVSAAIYVVIANEINSVFAIFLLTFFVCVAVSFIFIYPPTFVSCGQSLRRTFKMSEIEDLRSLD